MELQLRKANESSLQQCDSHSCPLAEMIKPRKRWTLACNTVYFIVAVSQKVLTKRASVAVSIVRSPSYVALGVALDRVPMLEDENHETPSSFPINQATLTALVRERNLEFLSQYGGVPHLASVLQTDPKLGVQTTAQDIGARKKAFGSNVYQNPTTKSFLSFVVEAFNDTTIIILLLCAVLSLGFGIKQHGLKEGWYDGGSIIIAIFLVVSVTAISNFKQRKQFEKLSKLSNNIQVEVLRDGCRQNISVFDVVVGDIVFLKIGDQVPADGLFLDGHSLKVDESSMTGESDHVDIDEVNNPFLISGTKVTDGFGRMVIISVGMNTSWGQMMSSVSQDSDEETPLQVRLNKLSSYIGKVGLLVASLVLVALSIRYFTLLL